MLLKFNIGTDGHDGTWSGVKLIVNEDYNNLLIEDVDYLEEESTPLEDVFKVKYVPEKKNPFDTPALRHTDYYKIYNLINNESEKIIEKLKEMITYEETEPTDKRYVTNTLCLYGIEFIEEILNYKYRTMTNYAMYGDAL